MPTGYTYKICEGKETNRNDFILGCARAFGALIEMRDSPFDAPIPEEFQPSSYHKEKIEHYQAELMKTLTIEEAQKFLNDEYEEKVNYNRSKIQEYKDTKKRYVDMIDEVSAWIAPSEEHQELKKFCIEQLKASIQHDCNYSYYEESPKKESVELWMLNKKADTEKQLAYHQTEWKKELERIRDRNHWVKLLRDSLV